MLQGPVAIQYLAMVLQHPTVTLCTAMMLKDPTVAVLSHNTTARHWCARALAGLRALCLGHHLHGGGHVASCLEPALPPCAGNLLREPGGVRLRARLAALGVL